MEPIQEIRGTAIPLWLSDVDTDQLLPKQFLTKLERTGYGEHLLYDWRTDGSSVLDDARYSGASILVAGRNFGSGSSREQAAWAVRDFGFRAVIAPSYGGLFKSNGVRSGVLPVDLAADRCETLVRMLEVDPGLVLEIDLAGNRLNVLGDDLTFPLQIPRATSRIFLEGIDFIERTLRLSPEIENYENDRDHWLPLTTEITTLN